MKGLLAKLRAWHADEDKQFLLLAAIAAVFVELWIKQASQRLVELERRWPDGMVPLDDVVTVGELERFRHEMEELVGIERPQVTEGDAGDAGDD